MKRVAFILLVVLPTLATGQVSPLFQNLISTSPVKPSPDKSENLEIFIQELQQKEMKTDKKLLKTIFRTTHQKFLKSYSQYADLGETFQAGRFDCLTATALFSVILNETHFNYRIIETNYHIFILVNTTAGQVLLETTDRFSGWVDSPKEINQRIGSYRQNKIVNSDNDKMYYHYSFDLFHEVAPNQLAGLLYFNQAVKAFNKHDLMACATLLEQSNKIYESPRIEELAMVLIKSATESDLTAETKNRIIQQSRNFLPSKSAPVASR